MALTYDLTAIKNHETACFEGEKLNPVTNTIIFYMMIVDLPAITEQNVAEAYARIAIYERLTSHLSHNGADITLADVVAHIGLKTNTSNASRAEWLKRVKDWVKRDLDEIHARAIKELAESSATV
jgi:hypothetical protein